MLIYALLAGRRERDDNRSTAAAASQCLFSLLSSDTHWIWGWRRRGGGHVSQQNCNNTAKVWARDKFEKGVNS